MIEVLKAVPAHGEVMAEIHRCAGAEPWDAGAMQSLLEKPGVSGLLAVESGVKGRGPLGFVLARRAADEAEILTIAVLPAARRQGIARRLLVSISKQLSLDGVLTLHLEVATGNGAARGLYASLGFEQTGKRPGYYRRAGSAEDALLLRLNLVEGAGRTR